MSAGTDAFGKPVVATHGATDPAAWAAPYGAQNDPPALQDSLF